MKKTFLLTLALSLFLALPSFAQSWETDYAAAVEKAKKENKTVLLNFTGSDWCGWCMKLSREVFSQEAFIDYANENLILVTLDFPRRKQLSEAEKAQNQKLAAKHAIRGYPTILLLDANEEVLLTTGYQRGGAEAYVAHLKAAIKS